MPGIHACNREQTAIRKDLHECFQRICEHGPDAWGRYNRPCRERILTFAQGALCTPELYVDLLRSRDAALIEEVSRIWSDRIRDLLAPGSKTSQQISRLLVSDPAEVLQAALGQGLALSPFRLAHLSECLRADDEKKFQFLSQAFAGRLVGDQVHLGNAISRCQEKCAPFLAQWLCAHATGYVSGAYISDHIPGIAMQDGKEIADKIVATFASLAPERLSDITRHTGLPPRSRRLLEMCASNHGRLRIRTELPSLTEILANGLPAT